ncbi:MAG: glycosyltransferase family 4 protein [Rhodospirillales bacterium]|nr:glycosyltransferase family 4 protein [Rhodospirillales bacterium]
MIIIFIHQNFPAQYQHLARHFADRPGNEIYFITQPNDNLMRGVTKVIYKPDAINGRVCHPFSADFDDAVRTGLSAADACRALKERGVRPDIIVGHSGWGETLFIKDVYPDVPLLSYFEFFYHVDGVDVGFDPEFASIFDQPARLRTKNAINFLSFDACDWGHTPTRWQQSLYPPEMRRRISPIHEGVDTEIVRPRRDAWLKLARAGKVLTKKDEVVTYVARNLEPYRGFHTFMRALPSIQRRRPRAHTIIVGGDGVSYGYPSLPGTTYRERMLQEVGRHLDLDRVHFLGQVPYDVYLNILQVSSVHVYLTYPFVLSWSFVESLAAGCLTVGSSTPPVLDVLQDRVNGLVADFFSPEEIADRVDEVLDHQDRMQMIREQARETAVTHFRLQRLLARWEKLLDDIVNERPPETQL